jgi:hypothetical protein
MVSPAEQTWEVGDSIDDGRRWHVGRMVFALVGERRFEVRFYDDLSNLRAVYEIEADSARWVRK